MREERKTVEVYDKTIEVTKVLAVIFTITVCSLVLYLS